MQKDCNGIAGKTQGGNAEKDRLWSLSEIGKDKDNIGLGKPEESAGIEKAEDRSFQKGDRSSDELLPQS